ncbi:MAG: sulfatase [Halobacteriaceae archaeon]
MRLLYIDIDSLRPDHLGCYCYGRDTSPNIDRIAERGRRFTNYYASDVPCLPSRTALFTGRFGFHTGVVNHAGINADIRHRGRRRGTGTRDEYATWPGALLEAGYRTAFVSPFPQRHGAFHVLDGFEEWYDTGGGGTERAEVVYPHAERWLSEHAGEQDWYLHVNFWDPHTHYDTPESFGDPFADDPAPEWPDEETIREHYRGYGPHSAHDLHHGYLTGDGPVEGVPRVPDEIASRADFVEWINGYDTGIAYMDAYVGRIFDRLEEAGVFEDTLVIVSADHGENQGELNVYGDHQTADDRTCRVPLLVSGPGVESGVDDGLHYNIDLPPTVLDLVGADTPAGWDGRSFAASVTDGDSVGREALVLGQGTWACQRAARWDDYLLIRTHHDGYKHFDPVELYDLSADPHETTDISDDRPDLVREGEAIIDEWRDARLRDAAAGQAGGNPDAPRNLVDPLFEVIQDGGPAYLRGNCESYTRRLRETGREQHAAEIERRDGIVDQPGR